MIFVRCFWPLAFSLATQIGIACTVGWRWWSLTVWVVIDLLILRYEVKLYWLYRQIAKAREEQRLVEAAILKSLRRSKSARLN